MTLSFETERCLVQIVANGRGSRVIVFDRATEARVHTDELNLARATQRAAFVGALPAEYQPGIAEGLANADLEVTREQLSAAPAERRSQVQTLIALAEEAGVELFRDDRSELYATMPVEEHAETWPLRSHAFTGWLRRAFEAAHHKPPSSTVVREAVEQLRARALGTMPQAVFVRVGESGGALYLDLGRPDWSAIEITPTGWRTVARPPVKFRRGQGTAPLPVPVRGQPLAALREFVNVSDDDWPLVLAWLVMALRARGPYPVLVVIGEQGSAKSTMCSLLRNLVDPSAVKRRRPPRDDRDVMIAAATNWVLLYDNLSGVRTWLSDMFCSLATDAGYGTRELYTDADEKLFTAQRPLILNGIADLAEREDLRDRAIIVTLPPLPETQRRDEASLLTAFDAVRPGLLGALLDAVSAGLGRLPTVTLSVPPRMADFAKWATACEPGLGLATGAFLRAYRANRGEAVATTLDVSPVARGVLRFAEQRDEIAEPFGPLWEGTAHELLRELTTYRDAAGTPITDEAARRAQREGGTIRAPIVSAADRRGPDWPKNERALGTALRELAPALRLVGIAIAFAGEPDGPRRQNDRRPLRIARCGVGGAVNDANP